jgi:hypothetical protein
MQVLPKFQYLHIHNIPIFGIIPLQFPIKLSLPIVINYVGLVSYFEENRKLIDSLKNNHLFQLNYYGKISDSFKININSLDLFNSKNIFFSGEEYDNSKKANFYENCFFINNLYGSDKVYKKLALSNKLYDAAIYKRPILVNKDTFMAKLVSKYKLGLVLDTSSSNFEDELFTYYSNFNFNEFNNNCKIFLNDVSDDLVAFSNEFKKFLL